MEECARCGTIGACSDPSSSSRCTGTFVIARGEIFGLALRSALRASQGLTPGKADDEEKQRHEQEGQGDIIDGCDKSLIFSLTSNSWMPRLPANG